MTRQEINRPQTPVQLEHASFGQQQSPFNNELESSEVIVDQAPHRSAHTRRQFLVGTAGLIGIITIDGIGCSRRSAPSPEPVVAPKLDDKIVVHIPSRSPNMVIPEDQLVTFEYNDKQYKMYRGENVLSNSNDGEVSKFQYYVMPSVSVFKSEFERALSNKQEVKGRPDIFMMELEVDLLPDSMKDAAISTVQSVKSITLARENVLLMPYSFVLSRLRQSGGSSNIQTELYREPSFEPLLIDGDPEIQYVNDGHKTKISLKIFGAEEELKLLGENPDSINFDFYVHSLDVETDRLSLTSRAVVKQTLDQIVKGDAINSLTTTQRNSSTVTGLDLGIFTVGGHGSDIVLEHNGNYYVERRQLKNILRSAAENISLDYTTSDPNRRLSVEQIVTQAQTWLDRVTGSAKVYADEHGKLVVDGNIAEDAKPIITQSLTTGIKDQLSTNRRSGGQSQDSDEDSKDGDSDSSDNSSSDSSGNYSSESYTSDDNASMSQNGLQLVKSLDIVQLNKASLDQLDQLKVATNVVKGDRCLHFSDKLAIGEDPPAPKRGPFRTRFEVTSLHVGDELDPALDGSDGGDFAIIFRVVDPKDVDRNGNARVQEFFWNYPQRGAPQPGDTVVVKEGQPSPFEQFKYADRAYKESGSKEWPINWNYSIETENSEVEVTAFLFEADIGINPYNSGAVLVDLDRLNKICDERMRADWNNSEGPNWKRFTFKPGESEQMEFELKKMTREHEPDSLRRGNVAKIRLVRE